MPYAEHLSDHHVDKMLFSMSPRILDVKLGRFRVISLNIDNYTEFSHFALRIEETGETTSYQLIILLLARCSAVESSSFRRSGVSTQPCSIECSRFGFRWLDSSQFRPVHVSGMCVIILVGACSEFAWYSMSGVQP